MECINFFIDEAEEIDKKVNFSGQTFLINGKRDCKR